MCRFPEFPASTFRVRHTFLEAVEVDEVSVEDYMRHSRSEPHHAGLWNESDLEPECDPSDCVALSFADEPANLDADEAPVWAESKAGSLSCPVLFYSVKNTFIQVDPAPERFGRVWTSPPKFESRDPDEELDIHIDLDVGVCDLVNTDDEFDLGCGKFGSHTIWASSGCESSSSCTSYCCESLSVQRQDRFEQVAVVDDLRNHERSAPVYKRNRTKKLWKHTCHYLVGIEEDLGFNVVKRLIGANAENIKAMVKKSGGAKVRIHGRGSCLRERSSLEERFDGPLRVCILAQTASKMQRACCEVEGLLARVHAEYQVVCEEIGLSIPQLSVARLAENHEDI